jgi:hypothetical protein
MRGVRGLVLLLVIAVPLGWYAYRDAKKGPVDDSPKHDKVFAVEADKIDELQIKSESGERTTLQRKGTSWDITQPAAAAPDEAAVSGITSNLSSLEVQRVVEENPADVTEFGLATPRVEVGFKAAGQQHRLQIGSKTPSGTDMYARLADQKKVFLISSFLDSIFNRGSFDLRDKTVLKLDREKVDALDVSTASGHAQEFRKVNGEWQLTSPVPARAEFTAVDGLVSRIASLQMKALVPPATAATPAYGLDKPAATVRIGSGSSQATLVLGAPAGEGAIYARDLSRPAVFTVEASILDDLKKDASEYRQKELFDARAFNATRIEIVNNAQTTIFEKTKTKDKDGKETETWRQAAPARDVDSAKVEALVSATTEARATGFADDQAKTGLDKPELTVVVKYDENKEDRVTFARAGGTAYAARAGSPGASIVDPSVIDGIVKALGDVK